MEYISVDNKLKNNRCQKNHSRTPLNKNKIVYQMTEYKERLMGIYVRCYALDFTSYYTRRGHRFIEAFLSASVDKNTICKFVTCDTKR